MYKHHKGELLKFIPCMEMSLDSYLKESNRNVKKRLKDEKMEFNEKLYYINYSPKNPLF